MKSPENQDPLHLSRRLLASLSDSIAAVQSFRGRWCAVAAKLDRLRADLDDLPNPTANPLSADLLRSLAQTLSTALTLALHCRSPDPPAGKLRTQSEIATVAASLDQHLSDAELLLKTGVLLEPPRLPEAVAAATAPPPSGSRREAVRVESRNLITRLQIGAAASRNAALDALIGLLREDDKNVLIAAAHGVVPALVRLLDSSCLETKEKAVAAIARVSAVESCRHVLVAEGVPLLNHLARVLESGSGFAKEKACVALQTLILTKENARTIGCRGGISSLLDICQAGTPASQAAAAGVLKNLAGIEEIRQSFVEENAVPVLIRVSASGTVSAQENAVACLRNLAAGEGQDLKLLIVREGGIDCLKNYWEGQHGGRNFEPAVGLLRNLASSKYLAEHLVAAGLVPRVVSALDSPVSATRTEAARAVYEVAQGGRTRKEFAGEAAAGCVRRLVRMLEAKGAEEKGAAVKALASLMAVHDNRRMFRKDERGIMNVVMLLEPLLSNVDKKYPISVLALISQSRKSRKRMVEAGACGFLQRLVDMEVEGAKRLLESLGKGKKLWALFGGR